MGHIEDRWWKVVADPVTRKRARVKAARHGTGHRYRVRYLDPEGHERSVSFPTARRRRQRTSSSESRAISARGPTSTRRRAGLLSADSCELGSIVRRLMPPRGTA
jgi:hypothetical protein